MVTAFRILALLAAALTAPGAAMADSLLFEIVLPSSRAESSLDGRVLLLLAADDAEEPRFQVRDSANSAQIFGVDVNGFAPGAAAAVDSSVPGYPAESLAGVAPGEYWAQAVLHRYETLRRADGHVVKLPMDRGEGQKWSRAPGNLYSAPRKVRVDPAANGVIRIELDQEIPPITPPEDTTYVKHVRIRSELLSKFWGRPMHLGAVVLLPEGFDEHPEARYPLIVNHGHFEATFGEFRESPPDPDLKPEYSERFRMDGYNVIQQQMAHEFYKEWTGPGFPRFVIIKVQHANPYYDDSYAVNSANLGPYGDAIMHELIPEIEKRFRCIGEGWARFTYGGSTGGWEALAVQVLYPDMFNGGFAACPDPIDFRAYTVVNIYEDRNAYFAEGPFGRVPRPGKRDWRGYTECTMEQVCRKELVLGEKNRSGDQWDIWEAVYSPVGADGYPKPLWNRRTGEIDPDVARHWRDHYDLRHIMQRDWETLGPKLKGKIHLYCGTMDNYFLEGAVRLTEEFLVNTTNPFYAGEVDYGCGAEHCWNGDHNRPNALSRLRYHQMYVDKILRRIADTAPPRADVVSWRY